MLKQAQKHIVSSNDTISKSFSDFFAYCALFTTPFFLPLVLKQDTSCASSCFVQGTSYLVEDTFSIPKCPPHTVLQKSIPHVSIRHYPSIKCKSWNSIWHLTTPIVLFYFISHLTYFQGRRLARATLAIAQGPVLFRAQKIYLYLYKWY